MTRPILLAALLAGTLGISTITSHAAPLSILLARGRTEPSVAVDPRHPKRIVVATNTNYSVPEGGGLPDGVYFSGNGGSSFGASAAPIVSPYTTEADPTVAIDRTGTVFFSLLGETPGYCSGGRSAVIVTHSTDGGRSFHGTQIVDSDPADDKPALAVENLKHHSSHVFVTWTRFHEAAKTSDIWFARSTNGGAFFQPPSRLHTSRLNETGSAPVVGPKGRIYVFWDSFPDRPETSPLRARIMMRVSADEGAHFGPVRTVFGPFTQVPLMAMPGSLRNITVPSVAVTHSGILYLTFPRVTTVYADKSVDADIVLLRSMNGGATWSRPFAVNTVRGGDRFMPTVSLMPDGSLGVAYYERRGAREQLNLYASHVIFDPNPRVSAAVRVSGGSSPVADITYLPPGSTCFLPGRFFGDYIGSAPLRDGRLAVAWTDTRLHVPQETDIWFAAVTLPPVGAR